MLYSVGVITSPLSRLIHKRAEWERYRDGPLRCRIVLLHWLMDFLGLVSMLCGNTEMWWGWCDMTIFVWIVFLNKKCFHEKCLVCPQGFARLSEWWGKPFFFLFIFTNKAKLEKHFRNYQKYICLNIIPYFRFIWKLKQ